MEKTMTRNNYTLKGNSIKRVMAKFAGMRKEQDFIVYPYKLGQTELFIQSDKSVGKFDIATGKGLLNYKCKGHNGFFQLNSFCGAVEIQYPADFVMICLEIQPGSGDRIGAHCFVA